MSATSELRQAVSATATAPEPRKVVALLCFGIASAIVAGSRRRF